MLLGGSSACFETGSPLVQTGFELDMYGSPKLASDSPCFHHLLTKCRDYRCAAPCLVELSLCQAFGSEALRWLVCYAFWSSRQSSSMWCIPQVSLLRSAVAGVLLVLSHLAFFSSWSPLLGPVLVRVTIAVMKHKDQVNLGGNDLFCLYLHITLH